MDKLKLWLIPGLVVIIALGGLVFLRGRTPDLEPITPGEVTEDKVDKPKGFAKPVEPAPEEKAKINSDAMAGALQSGNVEDCEKIVFDKALQGKCKDNLNYAGILQSGDEKLCDTLTDETLRIQCHNKIYISAAVDKRDLSICDMISDLGVAQLCRDQVQSILSRYATSVTDCDSISSAQLKDQCKNNFQLQASAETLDLATCDNITDGTLAQQCKTAVNTNLKIVEESKQAAATAQVAKTPQEIFSICEQLSGVRETACKDAVYPELALNEKDPSYCDKMSDAASATACKKQTEIAMNQFYLRESISKKDKEICEKITESELKTLCQSS